MKDAIQIEAIFICGENLALHFVRDWQSLQKIKCLLSYLFRLEQPK